MLMPLFQNFLSFLSCEAQKDGYIGGGGGLGSVLTPILVCLLEPKKTIACRFFFFQIPVN
jgi:hypothetical protein